MLRDWAGILLAAVRGCSSGAWVAWPVVVFAVERGP
jgi:hypothetical protein